MVNAGGNQSKISITFRRHSHAIFSDLPDPSQVFEWETHSVKFVTEGTGNTVEIKSVDDNQDDLNNQEQTPKLTWHYGVDTTQEAEGEEKSLLGNSSSLSPLFICTITGNLFTRS